MYLYKGRFLSSGQKGVAFPVFWEISGIFLSLYDRISPYGSYSTVLFLLGFLYVSSKVLHGASPVSVNAIIIMLQYSVWLPIFSFCWQLVDLTIPSSFPKTHSRHLYGFVSRIYMSLKYQGPNLTWHINFPLTALSALQKSWNLCCYYRSVIVSTPLPPKVWSSQKPTVPS